MFNAIIVDDELPALNVLRRALENTGQIRVVGSYLQASGALAELHALQPDVAFLDIVMPEMSGLDLAEKIIETDSDTEIIFVTAYHQYALDAFRVNAIDYLLKPSSSDDIAKTVARLKKRRPLPAVSQMSKDKGCIRCFGRLSVRGADLGKSVKWRTAKAEELFAFLLQHLGEDVSKWRIAQALWPECETEKLNIFMHTTIYQVKKTLLSAKIGFDLSFANGRYKLELPDVYIDAAEFAAITNDDDMAFTAASVERYKKAIALYKGNYLEENGYPWSQNKAEELSKRYRGLISRLAGYYMTQADYLAAEEILQRALTTIPLDDDLNGMLLRLYSLKKDKASLVMHYNKVKELYRIELGILPGKTMQDLFNSASEL